MENMCSNCGFYKTPPLFWGGSTEPLLCNCPKERSYSEEDLKEAFGMNDKDWICFEEWFEQFKQIKERANNLMRLKKGFKDKQ